MAPTMNRDCQLFVTITNLLNDHYELPIQESIKKKTVVYFNLIFILAIIHKRRKMRNLPYYEKCVEDPDIWMLLQTLKLSCSLICPSIHSFTSQLTSNCSISGLLS